MNELKKCDWHGNIRELKNVVERDYYLSEDEFMNITTLNYNHIDETINEEKVIDEEIKIVPLEEVEKSAIKYRKIKKYEIYVSK